MQYYIVEDKLDGISIDLEYTNGKLIAATTRGDGKVGQDILGNVLNMQNVKKTLDKEFSFTGNIRGEIVMTKTDFTELCKHEDLKNRRNSASGIATRQDGKYSDYLTILYYDIIEEGNDFPMEHDKMFRIKQLGLNTSTYTLCKSIDHVIEVMNNHIESLREKKDFDIDGLVVKLNNIEYQEEQGKGSEGNPKGQIAWKFPNETAVTILKDIEWSMGKGGAVTPVAIFEATLVAGGMLARASLGSYGEFKRLKLHKGDKIEISRRNDVIPHVEKVIKASSNPVFVAPTNCPECGKPLVISDKKVHCKNKSCSALGLET
jgi:DNA ligase (NAD+)